MNIKRLLGLQTPKDKFEEYKSFRNRLKEIDNLGKELSEQFMIQKSIIDNIDELPETLKVERIDMFQKFMSGHKKKVSSLCNERNKILKSIKECEEDKDIAGACKELKTLDKCREAYLSGKMTKEKYFDIYKSITGEPIKYADVVAMTDDGEILILHRVDDDFNPTGEVCIPGGHVDEGEDFETAALRELKEETNLDPIEDKGIVELGEYKSSDAHIKYYMVHVDKKKPVTVDASEHCFHEYINISQIPFKPFIFDQGKNVMNFLMKPHMNEVRPLMKALEEGRMTEDVFIDACNKVLKKAMSTESEEPLIPESMEGVKRKAVFLVRDPENDVRSIINLVDGCSSLNMNERDVEFKDPLCIHDCFYKADPSGNDLVQMEVIFSGNEEDMMALLRNLGSGFLSGSVMNIRTPHEEFMSANENGTDYVGEPVFVSL